MFKLYVLNPVEIIDGEEVQNTTRAMDFYGEYATRNEAEEAARNGIEQGWWTDYTVE